MKVIILEKDKSLQRVLIMQEFVLFFHIIKFALQVKHKRNNEPQRHNAADAAPKGVHKKYN